MYPAAAQSFTLYEGLRRIDEDLAAEAQSRGCPYCGGILDRSPWLRKPRGCEVPEKACWRLGLCCRSCRRRVLPLSTLFWGRKVYWGAVVLVCVVMRQRRLEGWAASALRKTFGMSSETLERWMALFAAEVPVSSVWRRLRGWVGSEVRDDGLPDQLLALFENAHAVGERALTAFLSFWVGRGFRTF